MTLTLLDGGMGQELLARSDKQATGLWSAQVLMDAPELVQGVHEDFYNAGADVATTNSYILHRDRLAQFDQENRFEALHISACEIACRARDNTSNSKALVAGGLGPNSRSYRPDLAFNLEKGAEAFAEIAQIQAPFVDLFLIETMSSIEQAQGAAMGAKTVGKPVWLSMSVDDSDGSKLRSGEALIDILPIAKDLNIDALFINCSTPEAVTIAVHELAHQDMTIGAYANGFTEIPDTYINVTATIDSFVARQDLGPLAYADFAQQWHDSGARIIGGCCEVGPAHIQELARRFK